MTDKIAVAIPSYKVQNHVLEVIAQIPANLTDRKSVV